MKAPDIHSQTATQVKLPAPEPQPVSKQIGMDGEYANDRPAEPTTKSGDNYDPFAPENLRIDPAKTHVSVVKELTSIPIAPPSKETYIRVHPEAEYTTTTKVLRLKDEGETYYVTPALRNILATEPTVITTTLVLYVTRLGTPKFWPLTPPGLDGRHNSWHASAMAAAEAGKSHWVRLTANREANGYTVAKANYTEEPLWPSKSMRDLLALAFRGKVIDSSDHPVLRKLRGEV